MSKVHHLGVIPVIAIATVLILSNFVGSNRIYETDDSIIMEATSSLYSNTLAAWEPWRYIREIIYLGPRPRPRLNLELIAITQGIYREEDKRKIYHSADLNTLPGRSFYETIPMTPVHLGLQQPRFYFPMLFYPSLVAPTPSSIKENGISAVYLNRQSTVGAGPSKNSGVQEVRIVGGAEAAKNSWPGIAFLRVDGYFRCGGTLISPTKILTAAQCLYGLWPWDVKRLSVDLGMHVWDPSDAQLVKKVKRFAQHLFFNPVDLANDIAILTLDSPVTYTSTISPVSLPPTGSSDQYTGQSATIVGWGYLDLAVGPPSALQQATIEIINNDQCTISYGDVINIRKSMLCATSPGKGPCSGDNGGPLFVRSSPDSPWIQAGIVSFAIGCANDQYPSVYTRVSSFLPWIKKHMFF